MSIYFLNNNKIYVDRYDKLPPSSGILENSPSSMLISNKDTVSDIERLQHSLDFGSDYYIKNNIKYKPIFKLYHQFYQ